MSLSRERGGGTGWWRRFVGPAFLILVVLAWCAPAITHGAVFGSYDYVLSATSLGRGLYSSVHNTGSADQARQDAAWLYLNSTSIRHLQFPLWNPFNGLGLPQFLNFQSAVLSLPSLVGYLFPLRYAYTASVLVRLMVAGTGTYFLARVLGVSRLGATLAGVVGELAGPYAAWAGWPQTSVAEWTGWLMALSLLVLRRPRPGRVALLAVVLALATYGGFPEVLVLVVAGCAVLVAVVAAGSLARPVSTASVEAPDRLPAGIARGPGATVGGEGAVVEFIHRASRAEVLRGLAGLLAGGGIGALLSAPLWLPGLQVLHLGAAWGRVAGTLPPSAAPALLSPAYFGVPTSRSPQFGPVNYYETAAFVGPVVLSLAAVAVVRHRRSVEVWGLASVVAIMAVLAYGGPGLSAVLTHVPVVRSLGISRGLLVLCTAVAALAGVGFDEARRRQRNRLPMHWEWGVFLAAGVSLAVLAAPDLFDRHFLQPPQRAIQLHGIILAALLEVLALVWLAVPTLRRQQPSVRAARSRGCVMPAVLVVTQAAVLVVVSAGINTWGHRSYPSTPAIRRLTHLVGDHRVGLAGAQPVGGPPTVGLLPDANLPYGLHELATYDASTQRAFELAWARSTGNPATATASLVGAPTQFFPAITSVSQARLFGTSYLLAPPGQWPATARGTAAGTSFVARLAGEDLYYVSATHLVTVEGVGGRVLSALRFGTNSTASVTVESPVATLIHVRISSSPGWVASTGEHSLPVRSWDDAMLAVWVPAGTHTVALVYRPPLLVDGLALAAAGAVLLVLLGLVELAQRRRRVARRVAQQGTHAPG